MSDTAIALGNEVTIAQAAAQRETLLAELAKAPRVLRLDLGAVNEFDSAGIQLLLAARHSLAQAGARLQIMAASPAVRRSLELFGLAALLEDGIAAEAR